MLHRGGAHESKIRADRIGQHVSDALEINLASDGIHLANYESHEQRQERRRLALHAMGPLGEDG